jgi:hypothetical protein
MAVHRRGWVRASWGIVALVTLLAGCASSSAGGGYAAPLASSTTAATGTGTGTGTAVPSVTPKPTPTRASGPYGFPLLPPGSALPSEAACAGRVTRSAWEPRPANAAANARRPTGAQLAGVAPWNASVGLDDRADAFRERVTGGFSGTTDEILQWVACVWGVPADIVRAEAVVESYWHQSQQGDQTAEQQYCPPGTWNGSGCNQSWGILQIKYRYFGGTWPMSRDDTAFSAEYVYGELRTCYEGWTTYLNDRQPLPSYPRYHAGDLWGCIGRWFSGSWYDQGAVDYIAKVKAALAQRTWRGAGF